MIGIDHFCRPSLRHWSPSHRKGFDIHKSTLALHGHLIANSDLSHFSLPFAVGELRRGYLIFALTTLDAP